MAGLERLSEGLPLSRRRALAWLGGLGLAAIVPGCADDEQAAAPATTAATTEGAADCVLMPELTEGPYYLDLDLVRRDITEGRPGVPFDLAVKVVDATSCEPIEGAAVDVWHCDAEGAYSGVAGRLRDIPPRRPDDRRRRRRSTSRRSSPAGTRAAPCTST